MSDYFRPLDERWGIAALLMLVAFGALVGLGKVLSRWGDPRHQGGIVVAIGNIIVSVVGCLVVGMLLIESMPDKPLMVVGLSGFGAWLGGGLLEPLARKLVIRLGKGVLDDNGNT